MDNVIKALNDTSTATSSAAKDFQQFNVSLGQTAIAMENAMGAIQSGMLEGSLTRMQNMFGGGNLGNLAQSINDPDFRRTLEGIGSATGNVIGGAAAAGLVGADKIIGSIGSLASLLTGGDGENGGSNLDDINQSVKELIAESKANRRNNIRTE